MDNNSEIPALKRLLFLNAMMEAARAGEAGKDLALTVGEVEEMTDQTPNATQS